jgi:hypothetical protein
MTHEPHLRDGDLGVPLADAIDHVRSALLEAQARGAEQPIVFVPESVEMEFEVVFSGTAGGEAGVHVWVVSVGAKAEVSRAEHQRIKISLRPVDRATGRSPQISGQGAH